MHEVIGQRAGVMTNLALPYPHHTPAVILGENRRTLVAFEVAAHLLGPELGVGSGPGGLPPMLGTPVPEAPVHEDSDVARWQDEVGGATLGDLPVQPEPAAGRMDRLAEQCLPCGVPRGALRAPC